MTPRRAAVHVLLRVESGDSLSAVLPEFQARVAEADRALLQELAYGVLRWRERLQFWAECLMNKPLRQRDRDVYWLVLIGLYQLAFLAIKPHAAVNETVRTAGPGGLRKLWAQKLVNGVLRNFQRRQDELQAALADAPTEVQAGLPSWLLSAWQHDWPEHWQAMAEASRQRPPMTLRVNPRRTSRQDWLARYHAQGGAAEADPHAPQGVRLERPVPVSELPGFASGDVSVQDAAAQLCAPLMDLQPGQRVLDACAAPGGKTLAMLEACDGLEMTALDVDASRLRRVEENLARADLDAMLLTADAARPTDWWDGRPYHRILLDAPCSATGVIRRHPDIKLLRRAEDIDELAARQLQLLEALWPLLAPGGLLLYATCSGLKRENEATVAAFLEKQAEARERPIRADWGMARPLGRQILPGQHDMDGFYYALLYKEGA